MNLIKKLFPKNETKSEVKIRLEKRISFLEGVNRSIFNQIKREFAQVKVSVEIGEREFLSGVPIDIIKEQLVKKLAEEIKHLVEFDMEDSPQGMTRILTGKIYVSLRRGNNETIGEM